jgi:hypothetical protein
VASWRDSSPRIGPASSRLVRFVGSIVYFLVIQPARPVFTGSVTFEDFSLFPTILKIRPSTHQHWDCNLRVLSYSP